MYILYMYVYKITQPGLLPNTSQWLMWAQSGYREPIYHFLRVPEARQVVQLVLLPLSCWAWHRRVSDPSIHYLLWPSTVPLQRPQAPETTFIFQTIHAFPSSLCTKGLPFQICGINSGEKGNDFRMPSLTKKWMTWRTYSLTHGSLQCPILAASFQRHPLRMSDSEPHSSLDPPSPSGPRGGLVVRVREAGPRGRGMEFTGEKTC